jgi:hypothetical protein
MMEAVSTSETSVSICHTTRRNIPEHSHLHTRRCENLKSHILFIIPNFLSLWVSPLFPSIIDILGKMSENQRNVSEDICVVEFMKTDYDYGKFGFIRGAWIS